MDPSSLGAPIERVDGFGRVTGRARYVAEMTPKGALHGVLVESDVPTGRIARVLDAAAKGAPGVRLVLTHENMMRLNPLEGTGPGSATEQRQPLQDDRIVHAGQHLALVVADTPERAAYAVSLLRFEIERAPFDVTLAFDDPRLVAPVNASGKEPLQVRKGDAEAAYLGSPKRHEAFYTTPTEHHNPMEPVATIAEWRRGELHLYETSRQIKAQQKAIAQSFGLPLERVHLQCPIVGGAFGSKGFLFGHILITAAAARMLGKPVRTVTTRRQMFGTQGHRARTIQQVALGATADGRLRAQRHRTTNDTATITSFIEHTGLTTQKLYASDTLETAHRNVAVDLPGPIFMRGPGEAPGPFALESAMDELAIELGIDPVDLRLRNDTPNDPQTGKPWSQRLLKECMERGGARFGWPNRNPKPRSMREGDELVGWGCASVAYRAGMARTTVRATLGKDGMATFRMAASDVGQGVVTAMEQVAADATGLPLAKVQVVVGDSDYPQAPGAGGSQTTASVGEGIVKAAQALKAAAGGDLARSPRRPVEIEATHEFDIEASPYAFHSWGAAFAEVRVDEALGMVRCTRFVGVYDVGRVVNARLVRSQLEGGVVWAIGMALQEHTVIDPRLGIYVNRDLAEYHVPVNRDVPDIDVSWLDVPDPHFGALGAHGVGEVGIAGAPAAIANAVYHATGKRIRDLPITLDKLL